MTRDIIQVLNMIIDQIPNSELVRGLMKVQQSAAFTALEAMPIRWRETANLLQSHLGSPDCDWKNKIADIMAGKL